MIWCHFEGLDLFGLELLVYFEFFLEIFDQFGDLLALDAVCLTAESIVGQDLLFTDTFQVWRVHTCSRIGTPRPIGTQIIFFLNVILEKVAVGPIYLDAGSVLEIHEFVQMDRGQIPIDLA